MRRWMRMALLAIAGICADPSATAQQAPPAPAQMMAIPPELRDALRLAVTERSKSQETRLDLPMQFLFDPQAGLGMTYDDAAKIALVTRVCLADRAGLCGSAPSPRSPRTSGDAAADLHAALGKAGVQGPYLLVGHSVGGLHAQVFASQYPADVAGLVLVSSTHPDQMTTWLSMLPAPAPGEARAISEVRSFLAGMLEDPMENPEQLDVPVSSAQARQLKTLGDKPVIVVTHSAGYRMAPGLPEPLAIELEAATQRMQKQFLSLSSNARQHIAAKAGHGLPHEDPGFVVENILEGAEAVRRTGGPP